MGVREDWPLWGTIVDAHTVYEIRKGPEPVTVWCCTAKKQVGYVTEYELVMAKQGSIPRIRLDPPVIAELAGDVINLRQAIGKLVRANHPDTVVQLRTLVLTTAVT